MLRQLLVGATVSVCNIAIHALVMTLVVEISSRIARAKHTMQQSLRLTNRHDCDCIDCDCTSHDGGTLFRGDGVVTGLRDRRCCTRRC